MKKNSPNQSSLSPPLPSATVNPLAQPLTDSSTSTPPQPADGARANFLANIMASTARPGRKSARAPAHASKKQEAQSGLPPQIRRILETPLEVFQALKDEQAPLGTPPLTYVAFVLDRSGSMESGKGDTIEGFNTQANAVKAGAAQAGETRIGMVDFASTPSVRYMGIDTSALEPLTVENYVPNGSTALYDGIGLVIAELLAQPHMESPETAVLVTIFTDGEENASTLYSPNVLKELITKLEATERWTFALVGPVDGVMNLADMLAVDRSNTTGFDPSSIDARLGTQAKMVRASTSYMNSRSTGKKSRKGLYTDDGSNDNDSSGNKS
jgi:Mg-chelatase subunit ChlD